MKRGRGGVGVDGAPTKPGGATGRLHRHTSLSLSLRLPPLWLLSCKGMRVAIAIGHQLFKTLCELVRVSGSTLGFGQFTVMLRNLCTKPGPIRNWFFPVWWERFCEVEKKQKSRILWNLFLFPWKKKKEKKEPCCHCLWSVFVTPVRNSPVETMSLLQF